MRPLCPQKNSTKHCLCRTCSRSRVFPLQRINLGPMAYKDMNRLAGFWAALNLFRLGVSGVFWKTTFYPKLKGLYHQTVSSDINGLQNVDETSISPYHTDTTTYSWTCSTLVYSSLLYFALREGCGQSILAIWYVYKLQPAIRKQPPS